MSCSHFSSGEEEWKIISHQSQTCVGQEECKVIFCISVTDFCSVLVLYFSNHLSWNKILWYLSLLIHRLGLISLHLISTIIVVVRTTNTTTMLLPLGPSTPVLKPVVDVLLSDLAVLSKLFGYVFDLLLFVSKVYLETCINENVLSSSQTLIFLLKFTNVLLPSQVHLKHSSSFSK